MPADSAELDRLVAGQERSVYSLRERLDAKSVRGIGCWLWTGFIDKAGYGRIRLGGRGSEIGYAHRVSYELHGGTVPDGLELDHLCRNRHCVNPEHLEPVTHAENVRRGAAALSIQTGRCKRGHDLDVHGYVRPDGRGRNCRECRRERRAAVAA